MARARLRIAALRVGVIAAAAAALAGCPKNEDYTPQIRVQPGAAARALAIQQHLHGAAGGGGSADAAAIAPSRVHVMKAGEELGGPNAIGRPGDLLLENDEVAFVIDRLGSSAGFAESGGNLVDAADARVRRDELGQLFTYFGTFPRQGVYDRVTSGVDPDGAAWVEASGHELYERALGVTTRYTLHPGDRALLLETTITNRGDKPIDELALGDAIQWGGAEKFAPGKSVGFRGPSSGPYVGGVGREVSYAITSTDGTIDALSGGSWTDTAQRKHVTLAPGQSAKYARVFVVGERPDVASLVAELTRASGGELGAIAIRLVDAAGRPVRPPSDAKVVLATPAGAEVMTVRARRDADADAIAADVPPGRYLAWYASGGGRTGRGAKGTIDVAANRATEATLGVTDAGRLALACSGDRGAGGDARARVPCKVTIEGIESTATPDFGPAHAAGPARNQITTADGAIDVPLAPGRYRVTLSRGPEYALAQLDVDVVPGKTAGAPSAEATILKRVVDTSGYLAADFHQHTMLGADAPVAKVDRVIANAAEGVEVAVATEHNVVADLEPIVRELHLDADMVALPGDELTTDASRHPWGHANVFPLAVDPTKPRGGAFAVRDRTPREVFAEVRAIDRPHVLQINHPRTGLTGYFDQTKFDRDAGVGSDPGYDPDFDALEVWNGRNVDAREPVLADYFALLRTGHVVTATADTDTHGVVGQEAGYPRTYVRVQDDGHLAAWDASRSADLVRGVRERRDVVLTNGPFLRVTANGAPIGGVARARGGAVTVSVRVECAPWVTVDRIRVARVNGGRVEPAESAPLRLRPSPSGARVGDATFTLRAGADDAFVVIATGAAPMTPVLSGDAKEITPYAMSGAIWIDGDGDGHALGR